MLRRWHLLLLTLLLALVVLNKVHANSDDDDDDDDEDKDDYNGEHYDGDECGEDHEKSKLLTPGGISPMAISGLGMVVSTSTCSDTGLSNKFFRRFNAIVFGDYYTFDGQESEGPLAVKGNFIATNYVVNANDGQDCSAEGTIDSYGLVVGGASSAKDVDVHGDALIKGGGDLTQLNEMESGCYVTGQQGTGVVDFIALEVEASRLNNLYRLHPPTLQLQADGSFKRLSDEDGGVEYMTFNSCNDRASCANIWPDEMSVPDNIFFGQPNWNGVQGTIQPDGSKTYVFNIPVIENTRITLTTNEPSQGFNGCKVVYNFYPVKQGTGEYSPTGEFIIARNTAGNLYGLTLAPRGNVVDGPIGHFAGQIVVLSYTWAFVNGVPLYDYKHAGGTCDYFDGCNPDTKPSCTADPATVTMTATETSVQTRLSIRTEKTTFTEQDTTTETDQITTTEHDTATERTTVTQKVTTTRETFTETVRVPITVTSPRDVTKTVTNANTVFATTTQFAGTVTKTNTATTTQLNTATLTKINTATVTEHETNTERTTITQRSTLTQTSRVTAKTTTTAHETEIDTIYLTEDHTFTRTFTKLLNYYSTATITVTPDTITTTTQKATVTEGVDTLTETLLSTVTTSVDVTHTATSTLETDITITQTVTSLLDYFTTVTDCDPCTHTYHHHDENCGHNPPHIHDENCEDDDDEDHKGKKKWSHKEYDEDDEDDDDDYY